MKFLCLFLLVFGWLTLSAQKSNTVLLVNSEQIVAAKKLLTLGNNKSDAVIAINLLQNYAAGGSTEAMVELGHIYRYGMYAQRDIKKAIAWFGEAAKKNNPIAWYYLGSIYKNATDATRNFKTAYNCYQQGAILGDIQSIYAQGYMQYKGLGVKQDYTKACNSFTKSSENVNSAYFLGLCYRNGYGVQINETLAKYWLKKAYENGFAIAKTEMESAPENSNTEAIAIAETYKQLVNTQNTPHNSYKKIDNVTASTVEGQYTGHIIRYDWSGKHAIYSARLVLDLVYKNGVLTGNWLEADSINVPINAIVTPSSLVFSNMEYLKKDHYNLFKPLPYRFDNAKLTWTTKNNETALQGNIEMFSVKMNEPEKPLQIFLKKTTKNTEDTATINLVNEDGSNILLNNNINAYPNPFSDVVTLNFKLLNKAQVVTKLLTIDGKLVYKNDAGILNAGYYALPIKPTQQLHAHTYLLVLEYGKYAKTIKIVKN